MASHRLAPPDLDAFSGIVGPANLLTDESSTREYTRDWTGRFCGATPAVLRPGTTGEVAAVVDHCRKAGVALTVQGGNTGLVGGSVPLHGEVVLSLGRLSQVGEVDAVSGQLTAGAGATLESVQEAADSAGWSYGVDLSARGSATIGGNVATNAGGLHVLRYGATRAQLLGVEAVLGTGETVRHLGGLTKDNTGYELAGLLCGSEGTLGVVTAARLRLVPPTPCKVVALLAFDDNAGAVAAAGALRRTLPSLSAAELFFDDGLSLVCEVLGLARPFDRPHRCYLLCEAADQVDPLAAIGEAVDSLSGVAEVAVAVDADRAAHLWQFREAHTTAINTIGVPHKLDVTLPTDRLAEFVGVVGSAVSEVAPVARTWLFGHAADGNIHVNVTGLGDDDFTVDDAVLCLAAGMGGSISAEHGIGTAKRKWLHLNRSDAELATFSAIKSALDPGRILNPHVLLPEA